MADLNRPDVGSIRQEMLTKITTFIVPLGFKIVHDDVLANKGFLPGIYLKGMTVLINPKHLVSAGDILHEVGHVAIIPSIFREDVSDNIEELLAPIAAKYCDSHEFIDENGTEDPIYRGILQCGETEAQAWSYAAAVAAGVPPKLVFHARAYQGESQSLLIMLNMGKHAGVHGLQAAKMTTTRTYPIMKRWLQI